jgi:hypothetical protein
VPFCSGICTLPEYLINAGKPRWLQNLDFVNFLTCINIQIDNHTNFLKPIPVKRVYECKSTLTTTPLLIYLCKYDVDLELPLHMLSICTVDDVIFFTSDE